MSRELAVLLGGAPVGVLSRDARGRIRFTYDEAWRTGSEGLPLSLSIPLAAREHGRAVVEPFLWNLLPDSETVLARWGQQFGVSPRNVFELLRYVGEDLAGAVQIVSPEQLGRLTQDTGEDQVEWLTEDQVAERLRALREDASAWRLPRDVGQFSLAGAQPKTALLEKDGKWGVPQGRTPTTHILKPPVGEWVDLAQNEHFCLRLAARLGLPVAASSVRRFGDEIAFVVERYDRVRQGGRILRVHQEDLCQSLSVHPATKYENEGGPGIREVVTLLRSASSSPAEDLHTFLDAVALNWLIGATDGHAKNYSVLLGSGGRVRLAPLYDVVSRLAYDPWHPFAFKLAMRVGSEYVLGRILPGHWLELAQSIAVPAETILSRLRELATMLPSAAGEIRDALLGSEGDGPVTHLLADRIIERGGQEARLLHQ